jgi:hypothetical protein
MQFNTVIWLLALSASADAVCRVRKFSTTFISQHRSESLFSAHPIEHWLKPSDLYRSLACTGSPINTRTLRMGVCNGPYGEQIRSIVPDGCNVGSGSGRNRMYLYNNRCSGGELSAIQPSISGPGCWGVAPGRHMKLTQNRLMKQLTLPCTLRMQYFGGQLRELCSKGWLQYCLIFVSSIEISLKPQSWQKATTLAPSQCPIF